MVRKYALYVDSPPLNIERRAKQLLAGSILVLHVLFIAWLLRTQPTIGDDLSSTLHVIELKYLTHTATSQTHHAEALNKTALKPSVDQARSAARQHADAARIADSARHPVVEGQLHPADGESSSTAAVITATVNGTRGLGDDVGQSIGGSGNQHRTHFVPPSVQKRWKSPYPLEAYRANQEGQADVLITVAADGSLIDARIDKSSGSESLDNATLAAIRRYTFKPALKGGNAIQADAIVSIDWRITPGIRQMMDITFPRDDRALEAAKVKQRVDFFGYGH